MPGWQTIGHEAQSSISQGTWKVQQGKGREELAREKMISCYVKGWKKRGCRWKAFALTTLNQLDVFMEYFSWTKENFVERECKLLPIKRELHDRHLNKVREYNPSSIGFKMRKCDNTEECGIGFYQHNFKGKRLTDESSKSWNILFKSIYFINFLIYSK